MSLSFHACELDVLSALVNNTFLLSKMNRFRVSVETSFDPIIHNELHLF